jgi:hypothetical protein
MSQIGGFLLDVCVKLFYTDRAYPLNPILIDQSYELPDGVNIIIFYQLKRIQIPIF